jgi:hypothetical protein
MTMAEPQSDKGRFLTITATRIIAVLMITGGLILAFGEREFLDPSIGFPVGLGLIGMGFVELFVVVPFLIRRWRSPE